MILMNYTTPNTGATATVHIVSQVSIDYSGSNMLTATVSSFVDEAAYAANKFAMFVQQIPIEGLPATGQDPQAYAESCLIGAAPADVVTPYTNRYVFAGGQIAANATATQTDTASSTPSTSEAVAPTA